MNKWTTLDATRWACARWSKQRTATWRRALAIGTSSGRSVSATSCARSFARRRRVLGLSSACIARPAPTSRGTRCLRPPARPSSRGGDTRRSALASVELADGVDAPGLVVVAADGRWPRSPRPASAGWRNSVTSEPERWRAPVRGARPRREGTERTGRDRASRLRASGPGRDAGRYSTPPSLTIAVGRGRRDHRGAVARRARSPSDAGLRPDQAGAGGHELVCRGLRRASWPSGCTSRPTHCRIISSRSSRRRRRSRRELLLILQEQYLLWCDGGSPDRRVGLLPMLPE